MTENNNGTTIPQLELQLQQYLYREYPQESALCKW